MDDTRTLSFDLTEYVEQPHFDDGYRDTAPTGVVDDTDALADARGFFRGLAVALSGWALVVLIALLAM
jgi:hypothetical protein